MPPSPKRRDRPRYSGGREALLDAAARVFAAHGVSGLTYRAVAEEARVTHGLVSYHFGSREALVHASLVRVAQRSIEEGSILPASRAIDDFAGQVPAQVENDPQSAIARYDLAIQSCRQTALQPEVRQLYRSYFSACAEALEQFGVEHDAATARVVFAAIDGLILQQLIFEEAADTEASLAALRGLIAGLAR